MHLTPPIPLSAPVSQEVIVGIAKVRETTLRSSELVILRFGKIPQPEILPWLIKCAELEFVEEMKVPRIAAGGGDTESLSVFRGEHLVIRDLDLSTTESSASDKSTDSASLTAQKGRIVAHAEWLYHPAQITDKSGANPSTEGAHPANPPPAGANMPLIKHFNELVTSTMKEVTSDAACYELHNVSTASSHLRKGIGKQLVSWIFPFADRDRLPVVLSASPAGYGLYKSCGFEDLTEDLTDEKNEPVLCSIDMEKWGGKGTHHHRCMVRWPSNWDGPRNWQLYKESLKMKEDTV